MKKNFLIVLLLLMFSGFMMTACNSKATLTGYFKNEEYAISIDEVVDFYDELEVKGFEKEQLVLSSSSDEVLAPLSNFEFKGITSGSAVLFASYQDQTIAQVKVNVKYKLVAPSNVNVDDNGKVTWDKSFVVAGDVKVEADLYEIAYKIAETDDETTLETIDNEFYLPAGARGRYEIKIIASSSNEIIDSVENTYFVNYGIMDNAKIIEFRTSENLTQNASFTWDPINNASYDVFINGIRLGKDLTESEFVYDFSKYKVGESIKLEIVVKDNLKVKDDSVTKFTLKILDKPALKYNYNGEAYLDCDYDEKAGGYLLNLKNLETGREETRIYYSEEEFEETLEGCQDGVYELALVALGGLNDEIYYLNSVASETVLAAKLKTPEVSVRFVDKTLNLIFKQDSYINRYMISWGEENKIFETSNGLVASYNLSDLDVGGYELKVKALPTVDAESENGVKAFSGIEETNNVLASDNFTFDFLVLQQMGEIVHRLEDETSTFIFEEVENANFYEIFINDKKVNAEYYSDGQNAYLSVEGLKNYAPVNSKYVVRIEAGVKIDNVEHAIRSVNTKTIEVLPLVLVPSSQVNGTFKWNSLGDDCLYYYEVYKVADDNYNINGLEPLYSQKVGDSKITETLTEGYYTIKITSISTDTNLYLDSNFHNENNVRLVNFIVTKDIATPNVTFKVEDNKYILTIKTVDKGGEYKVFVNGKSDGSLLLSELKDEIQYVLKDELANEQTHEIEVIAGSGKLFDGNVYLDSEANKVNVTRLERAEYEVEAKYSAFDELTGFNLKVSEQLGASHIIFKLNGEEINSENFQLDMSDNTIFGSEFTIEMVVVAGNGSGNNYFINSHKEIVEFERVASPSMMKYENGVLSWTYDDERADKYLITIILTNSRGSDLPYCFFTDSLECEYDIQEKINSLREEDESFDTSYRQAESVKIEIIAFTNAMKDGKYLLASAKGTTISGENAIVRNQLQSPQLSFDPVGKILSWSSEADGTVYDIYLDGEIYIEDYEENSLSIEDRLAEFSRQREITLQAKNPIYLESDISSVIRIKQISLPSIVSIDKVGEEFIASFDIPSDTAYISAVMVNGTTDQSLINYTPGGNTVNFKLKDFDSDLTIVIKAKNESTINYYVDSNEMVVSMTDLNTCAFEATVESDKISWTEIGSDFNGNNIDPITYELNISDGVKNYKLQIKGQTSILLDEIEKEIKAKLSGEIEVKVFAYVDSHYTFDVSQDGLIGYYGRTEESSTNTEKLAKVEEFRIEIIEEENSSIAQTPIEKTSNSSLIVKFDDLWVDFDNIYLNIEIAGEKLARIPATGIDLMLYRLTKSAGEYTLYVSSAIISPLNAGDIQVSVYVERETSITSDKADFTVKKFDIVKNTVVYDEGRLQINDNQEGAAYKVEIAIENISVTKILSEEKSLNLITEELFLDRYGDYTIRLIAVDENNKIIPSSQIATIKGYKLQGIESITIDGKGNINANLYPDDFENIQFLAKHNDVEKLIDLTRIESADTFYISMVETLRLFDEDFESIGLQSFDLLVRKTGSINSDYVNVKFEFAREASLPKLTRNLNLDKDYILFDVDDKTTSIRVAFSYEEDTEEGLKTITEVQYYTIDDILGYWKVENGNLSGDFVKERGGEEVEGQFTYTRKIGVSVNEILKEKFGQYSIEIARVGFDGPVAYQYKPEVLDLYKLNTIDSDSTRAKIESNILRFEWHLEDYDCPDPSIRPTSYMIYFKDSTNTVVESVVTYTSSFDIRTTTKLLTKTQYSVYVVALNNSFNIIASDEVTNDKLSILIFPEPSQLEVKNGRLIFKADEFENSEFINDIKAYFQDKGSQPYYALVGEKTYTSPYYFSPATLSDFNVTLKFNKMVNGKRTDEVYYKTIQAYHLFPDVIIENIVQDGYDTVDGKASYFDLLRMYRTTITSNPAAESTNKMIEALNTSARGIGDFYYTFDDSFKQIPAGDYTVSIAQSTINSYIESSNSGSISLTVAPAPEILLDTDLIEMGDTQKTYYVVDVKTILSKIPAGEDNYQENSNVLRYKLQLRENDSVSTGSRNDTIDFIIYYDEIEGEWIINYGDYADLKYSNRFTDGDECRVITTIDGENQFRINMSELKNAVNDAVGREIVKINVSYSADIFAYYQDNNCLLNGKSGSFKLSYLDLQADDFIFRNGVLTVKAGGEDYQLLMKYRHSQEYQEQTTTLEFSDNSMVNIELNRAGTYEYIKLSINGKISKKEMQIESAVYMINNIHKLSAPEITTADGSLSITYAEDDLRPTGEISFYMGNNESLKDGYEGTDKGYYFNEKYIGAVPLYVVGALSKESNDVAYPSELLANVYYAYLGGNNGSFVSSEDTSKQVDYLLSFNGVDEIPILSSVQASIKARMLGGVDSFSIEKGDIKINSDEVEYNLLDSDRNEGRVLYEINIDYYYIDNEDNYQYLMTEQIYSERQDLAEQYVSGLAVNLRTDYYKLSVGLIGAKKVADGSSGAGVINTVEGTSFQIYNHLVYNDEDAQTNPTYVLRGLVNNELEGYINRTINPRLSQSVTGNGVKRGKLNFVVDKSVYYTEPGYPDITSATSERIKVYADYEVGATTRTSIITGQYSFTTSSAEDFANDIFVTFTPDEGQLDTIKPFVLRVYAYGKDAEGRNAIISAPLVINDVYKLPNLKDDYYEVILTDGKTGIDFSKYFENVSIQDNKSCYAIVATAIMQEGDNIVERFTMDSSTSKIFVIPNGAIRVDLQVQDNQSDNEINAKKLLPSDTKRMETQLTTVEDLEINWNNILKRFEWSWSEDNQNIYDYVVTVTVNGVDEVAVVSENFYCPRACSGVISENGFKVKARVVDSENDKISIYSEDKVFIHEAIIYELFSAGEGTQKDPYKLNKVEDFKNMALRNTADYYFELGNNFEIKISDLIADDGVSSIFEEFNAKLNGRNRSLTIVSNYAFEMDEFSFDIYSLVKLYSNYYSSIFKTISSTGSVTNISLRYQIKDLNITNKNIMFAPICLNNYGTIENVTLADFNISITGQQERCVAGFAIGGFASINYGTINDCTNNAGFSFEAPQMVELTFAYGGITLFNANSGGNTGNIVSCFNKKDKSVELSATGSKLYMAGIALTNMGNISLCGNDSNFTVGDGSAGISASAFFAGITISNKNGSLEYLYNNGKFESKSNTITGSNGFSGIVYQIEGGRIQSLIVTKSRQPIVKNITTTPTDLGGHYAGNNSGTHTNILPSELAETEINCINGKVIRIRNNDGEYIASIV